MSCGPDCRRIGSARHEAAVDHDLLPVGQARRAEHEIARAFDVVADRRAAGVDQRVAVLEKLDAQAHAREFGILRRHPGPFGGRRQRDRRIAEPAVQRRDQRFLPGLALELPGAEPEQDDAAPRAPPRPAPASPLARAPRSRRTSIGAAFGGAVVILQRDHQALHRAQRQQRRRQDQRQPQQRMQPERRLVLEFDDRARSRPR